jgi:hypothetical protein
MAIIKKRRITTTGGPPVDYELFRQKMLMLSGQDAPEPAEQPATDITDIEDTPLVSKIRTIKLYYTQSSEHSDKVYFMNIAKDVRYKDVYFVNFQYGKRSKTLRDGTKTKIGVSFAEATRIFDAVVTEKKNEGYTENVNGIPFSR